MKLLVVEDSIDSQKLINVSLAQKYDLEFAPSVKIALEKVKSTKYSSIIVDINLPDGSGFELIQKLTMLELIKDTPILILTSDKEISSITMGFNLGADDYIVKPVHPIELLARVDSKIKKSMKSSRESGKLSVYPFELDSEKYLASIYNGDTKVETLSLTPIEFRILHKLVQSPNRVFTRENLINEVWGSRHHIEGRSIDKHISGLRNKLGNYRDFVKTRFGLGYSFELPKSAKSKPSLNYEQLNFSETEVDAEIKPHIPNFIEARMNDMEQIEEFLKKSDFQSISKICHNIIGVAAPYGFSSLENIVRKMYLACVNQERDRVCDLLFEMRGYLTKFSKVAKVDSSKFVL